MDQQQDPYEQLKKAFEEAEDKNEFLFEFLIATNNKLDMMSLALKQNFTAINEHFKYIDQQIKNPPESKSPLILPR